jgi:hypothetical protein
MSITSYATLQDAIVEWVNETSIVQAVPTFIQLAESGFNRQIRHWKMEKRANGQQSGGDQYMQVPADWLETIRFQLTGSGTSAVTMASRAAIADIRAKNENVSTVLPYYYTHADGQFELYPTPAEDTDFELLYYAKIPALSTQYTTNWLLEEAPEVYLFGSLVQAAPYLAEDARIPVWEQKYKEAVAELNLSSEQARYSGSGMTLKVRGLG